MGHFVLFVFSGEAAKGLASLEPDHSLYLDHHSSSEVLKRDGGAAD